MHLWHSCFAVSLHVHLQKPRRTAQTWFFCTSSFGRVSHCQCISSFFSSYSFSKNCQLPLDLFLLLLKMVDHTTQQEKAAGIPATIPRTTTRNAQSQPSITRRIKTAWIEFMMWSKIGLLRLRRRVTQLFKRS